MYKIFVNTQIVGSSLIFLPKCHSTNDQANELYEKRLIGDGGVVITDHQTAGRGQRGNTWLSEPGSNLTFTVVLTPEKLDIDKNFYLNVFSALAIRKAIEPFLINNIKVKWPNDIYVGVQKVGGILIENSIQGKSIMKSTIGFGLNVNQTAFPKMINAASLAMITGSQLDLNQLLNDVITEMDRYYLLVIDGKFETLREEYLENLYWKNERHLFQSDHTFHGIIRDIDLVGKLIVETKSGLKKFDYKEITFIN